MTGDALAHQAPTPLDVAAGQVLSALVVDELARAERWARVLEALLIGAPPVDQDGPRA